MTRNSINIQSLKLGTFLFFAFTLGMVLSFDGCSGGSQGTGRIRVEGRVLGIDTAPISGVMITDLETGSSDTSDEAGSYAVESEAVQGQIRLAVDTDRFSETVALSEIGETIRVVMVDLTVSDDDDSVTPGEISTSEDEASSDEEGDSKKDSNEHEDDSPSAKATRTPKPGSTNENKGEKSPSPHPTAAPTATGIPSSSTPTPSTTGGTIAPTSTPTEELEDVEAEGSISSLSSSSITVKGKTFDLVSGTSYRDKDGKSISLSSFSVGDSVSVKGFFQAGHNIAERVTLKTEDSESGHHSEEGEDVEAEGRIQSLSSSSMTVRNVQFVLTGSTKYRSKNENTVSLSYFELNDSVHVVGKRQNGENVALSVKETD